MDNAELAACFEEMAERMEAKGDEDPYRIRAFRRIAKVLEHLPRPATELLEEGALARVPGIGRGGVERIVDLAGTGTCFELERLRRAVPDGLLELYSIRGLGRKTIRELYAVLRVGSVDELERLARSGQVARAPGFSLERQARILAAVEAHRRAAPGRSTLSEGIALGLGFVAAVRAEPGVEWAELAGSVRRRKVSVGDLDVLASAAAPAPLVRAFVAAPGVVEVLTRGEAKASVLHESGRQVDLVVAPPERFGAARHYFTGSQQHNIYLRARGNRLGVKISDKGIFRRADEALLDRAASEDRVFLAVGLPPIPPELRENTGEIEAAAAGRLPRLVEALPGDLGLRPARPELARPMAEAAAARGDRFVALPAGSVDPAALSAELGIRVLVRVPAPADPAPGRLRVLAIEPGLTTREVVAKIAAGGADLLSFAATPILAGPARRPSGLDWPAVVEASSRAGVGLLAVANARALAIDSVSLRAAKDRGVPIAPTAEATTPEEMGELEYALYAARRGWLEAKDLYAPSPGAAPIPARPDLAAALSARPLDEALAARLAEFLAGRADPELEAALGERALQAAYDLLFRASE